MENTLNNEVLVYAGNRYEEKITVTDEAVRSFAEVSTDCNPIHIDDEAASKSIFKRRVAHGMLTACYMVAASVRGFKQYGGVHLGQSFKFYKPVYIGDELTIEVVVKEINTSNGRAVMILNAYNSQGEKVLEGECRSIAAPGTY